MGTATGADSSRPTTTTRSRRPGAVARTLSAVVALGAFGALLLLPTPYAIETPGPVFDTLAQSQGTDRVTVTGRPTYPTGGELDMLTVGVYGGPGNPVTAGQVVASWFNPDERVVPAEALYPLGQSQGEATAETTAEMTSSQDLSTAAALGSLGIAFGQEVVVGAVSDTGTAAGRLREGDVLLEISGTRPQSPADVVRAVSQRDEVAIRYRRDGAVADVVLPTAPGQNGRAIGATVGTAYDFPVRVAFADDNVGGPSAGMIFALTIVDKLTPGAMTEGRHIAGTGTITPAGDVGGIGGIRQKLVAARADGAELFLAPRENCGEVVGVGTGDMQVAAVGTLAEARAAIADFAAGNIPALPRCS